MENGVQEELERWYNLSLTFPHGCTPGSSAALYYDLQHVFQALEIVTNNGPDRVGGGGTPRAPLAPPICSEDGDEMPFAEVRRLRLH